MVQPNESTHVGRVLCFNHQTTLNLHIRQENSILNVHCFIACPFNVNHHDNLQKTPGLLKVIRLMVRSIARSASLIGAINDSKQRQRTSWIPTVVFCLNATTSQLFSLGKLLVILCVCCCRGWLIDAFRAWPAWYECSARVTTNRSSCGKEGL